MALIDRIENLREAPIQKRKMIRAVIVAIMMLAVVAIWIVSLKQSAETPTQQASTTENPFSLLWNSLKDVVKNQQK